MNKTLVLGLGILAIALVPLAAAQSSGAPDNNYSQGAWAALGAGLAVGLAGLGTGLAQAQIGAAAVGATAEDAGFLGRGILFVAIPETVVIFGLLISFLLIGKVI